MVSREAWPMSTDHTQQRKVLLFEMNEVPWSVIDDFVRRHPNSHLAGIMARARQFETVCEDQVELDPWISWPTLHRGVIDQQHGIRHLGQALESTDLRYPPIWDLLARNGTSVGIFGSLHSSRVPQSLEGYAFYVPDFFADEAFAHPAEMQAFQEFNLLMTRRSARNVDGGIPLRPAMAFLREYARAGLNWSTIGKLLAALARERRSPHFKSRRRSLQPLLSLDVFIPLVRRTRPDFATFYTNHVAANMHRFWAAAYPDDLADNPMPSDWRRRYAGEIDYSMHVLDGMLGRLRVLADSSGYLLVAASSIGQAPVRATRIPGFTTLTDLDRFMARMGFPQGRWKRKPAMVPCISVWVDAADADAFERRLDSLTIGKHRVGKAQREGHAPFTYDRAADGSFHFCVYFEELELSELAANVGGVATPAADLGLGFFPHDEEVACSGRHTPFGALMVYDPGRAVRTEQRSTISTLHVAPALLHNFGVPVPDYMASCDPSLLDVTASGRPVSVQFRGGGVETPVTRVGQEALALRAS
jgi:hypothetical protein